ncbi:MAG: hypothetical protein AAF682_19560 [Planctomycetota bacterium]
MLETGLSRWELEVARARRLALAPPRPRSVGAIFCLVTKGGEKASEASLARVAFTRICVEEDRFEADLVQPSGPCVLELLRDVPDLAQLRCWLQIRVREDPLLDFLCGWVLLDRDPKAGAKTGEAIEVALAGFLAQDGRTAFPVGLPS